ncbi:class I SAM-dependent methyltransferase [Roseovarius pelagicus]|uniref:Class I SAM-dependent methyltransferase n=1 Tax=Roseovarius pelagicus TaxID=2980108 RepID=A0ABY6DFR2_9RHOB|nr:class I SAM-dependent methyltransferase [Roseovarius pelagicus]UXX84991.1 class I SAM-dependent methyltransferase [Roseovarius pelagicus]
MAEITDPDTINAFLEYPLPSVAKGFPNGWMSASDLQTIYNAARRTTGDVLEVGPWLGRSSTAIAAGLRDREAEGGARVKYDIIDFGIASAEEWQQRFNQKLRLNHDNGRVAEAVLHPGGSNAVMVNNLKMNDLLGYTTTIMRGDIVDSPIQRKYSMIFCDALHDIAEIERNMPRMAELVAPGCIFVADDVVTDETAECVRSYLDVKEFFFTKTIRRKRSKLCVFQIADVEKPNSVGTIGKTVKAATGSKTKIAKKSTAKPKTKTTAKKTRSTETASA